MKTDVLSFNTYLKRVTVRIFILIKPLLVCTHLHIPNLDSIIC